MSSISSGLSIYDPQVKALDMDKLQRINFANLDEESYQRILDARKNILESSGYGASDIQNSPVREAYATVAVGGKTVATLGNDGFVESSNSVGQKIRHLFQNEGQGMTGPALAQARAEKIAELLGGEVVKSATAMTQAEFNDTPKYTRPLTDYAVKLTYEDLQKSDQTKTLFLTQQIGQNDRVGDGTSEIVAQTGVEEDTEQTTRSDVVQEFLDYMNMTPEERYYEMLLAEEGLTKEQLEALPPDERAEIEAKIQNKMEERIAEKTENADLDRKDKA